MKKYKNCINQPLLDIDEDQLVLSVVPPPELHLLIGATNKKLELVREYLAKFGSKDRLWEWCHRNGVTQQGKLSI